MFPSINNNNINNNPTTKPSTPRHLVSAGGLSTVTSATTTVSAATAARQQRIQDSTNSSRFETWSKAEEPLWERKSPRFFNAQKYVRANPYPPLYRGSATTGALAPLSRRDEEERHIRPPTVSSTTPRRAVNALLGERGEYELIHRVLPRDKDQQKIHLLSAASTSTTSAATTVKQQQTNIFRRNVSPGSNNNNNMPNPHDAPSTRRPSELQTSNFAPSIHHHNHNNKQKNDYNSSDEDDAFGDTEYYQHRRNRPSIIENNENNNNNNKKKNKIINNYDRGSDDDDDDDDDEDEDLENTFSRKSPDNKSNNDHDDDEKNKAQQQSAINRRAFELLRRLFILQVGERSVTRSFLDKLPSAEVIERIEHVLGRVGASRFMSLDDFHLVLNQALCPNSGAANSALPSASEAIGGSLMMSPRSAVRNRQKRTESFTEKQRKLNGAKTATPSLMISGVPTLETSSPTNQAALIPPNNNALLKITNNSTSSGNNKNNHNNNSNLQAPSLDATMNQTMGSLTMTYGGNYKMTANQDRIVPEINSTATITDQTPKPISKKPSMILPQNNNINNNITTRAAASVSMLGFLPPPPLGGSGSGIPMGFVDEDTSHITTTESRILFSLFESNGLVSIQQIKEGFDLLLRGEEYALLAYTRKIVCEPDNSEKESTVTVLELEWMLGAVCNYFKGDAELRQHSNALVANLWREAHQGCVARRTFRLAVLDDPLLYRAITILPKYGSADAFALRPEQHAPLVADPMKMMNMTAEMVNPQHNNNSNNNNNNNSSILDASVNFPSSIANKQNNDKNALLLSSPTTSNISSKKDGLKKAGSGVNFDPRVIIAEDEKTKKPGKSGTTSTAGGGGRGLAFETLDLYDPHFKGDQFLSKDPKKLADAATKEAGDPQFFSLRGQPYISVFGGPPQPIFDVRN